MNTGHGAWSSRIAMALCLLAACTGGALGQGVELAADSTTATQGALGLALNVELGSAGQEVSDLQFDVVFDADVTLTVGKGSFQIELLGEDDQVTLTLAARDGETVSGRGQMKVDSFGEANYRVTAVEAEDVAYTIDYTYQ